MKSHALPAFALLASFVVATPLAAAGPGKPTDPPCGGLTTYMATLPSSPSPTSRRKGSSSPARKRSSPATSTRCWRQSGASALSRRSPPPSSST